MRSERRVIPILNALSSSQIDRFVPYLLDNTLQVEKQFFSTGLPISEYKMDDFVADNKLVLTWFSQLQQQFNEWRNQQYSKSVAPVNLVPTGSRSFNASYTESDLECAIVSENVDDFLDFCRYLNAKYGNGHDFMALKTSTGLPLLIIKGEAGFCCPELSKLYPNKTLPQLEVTFRHPSVHQVIQNAGTHFFAELNPEQLESYVFNKRYIELMLRNTPKEAIFEGESLINVLDAFKGALSAAVTCLPLGALQDAPPFNKEVFANAIKLKKTLSITQTHSLFGNDKIPHESVTKRQRCLTRLSEETSAHCAYLASIGLADRAPYFKVKPFIYQDYIPETIDISRFSHSMVLPDIVRTYNPHEKNTLFANSESSEKDQEQEIKRALDIRLYPTIRRIIEENSSNIFLGSKTELQAYTESNQEELFIEIEVPSSVKFYIAINQSGDIKVYISNLVSHENLIQQLITLKIAGIDLQRIPILGDTQHYKLVCKEDLLAFEKQASAYLAKKNVLIVAGCSLEETACSTLEQIFNGKVSKKKFSGNLVSLTYVQSQHAPSLGFIVLNLNYGEICEEQISIILEKFNCIGIFSGSAAGYIPNNIQEELPDIGSRISVHSARHHSGELVTLDKQNTNLHLHVPTIFVETFDWLNNAAELGANTVDVETFYILRAIQKYQQANPQAKINTDIGVFISDYLGKKPLRSYHDVFSQYPSVLHNFMEQVLVASVTSSYNNNRTSIPTFSSQYFSIKPETIEINRAIRREPVVDCIGKCWDKSEFSKRVHTPVTIGSVKDQTCFSTKQVPRCLHLPIKLAGSDIRIPEEYQHLSDILQQIFNFESSINPGWNDLYAYLTVDQSFVPRSNFQRVPGPHVDGIPRDRENPEAQLIDHAYLVTDAIPTMFYAQQFDMNAYDPKIHHFFAIFRALADESRTITVNPFEIVLMNAYSVHTPTQTQKDVNRTFARLEFSTIPFDRIGNSINHHFSSDDKYPDYPFNYIPRPIPKHLFVPPDVYCNKPVTNEDYSHEQIDSIGRAKLRAIFMHSDQFKFKHSDYKDLKLIARDIMNEETSGIVVTHQGIPHAFCLYKIENKTVKVNTLFTLTSGRGQEMMIHEMKILKQLSDRLSIQAGLEEGATPITIDINENNNNMLPYFLRAARHAKVEVNIVEQKSVAKNRPENGGCYSLKELCIFTIRKHGIRCDEVELENNSYGLKA